MSLQYFLIGADIVPTKSNISMFINGKTEELLGSELANVIKNANYRIFNLETPLVDHENPITKLGPHLRSPTTAIKGYKQMGVDLLTLANNHIMDQGGSGLESTIHVIEREGIAHVGAGFDIEQAQKPYVFDFLGKTIGVYACAEHEFSIATEDCPGANPYDPLFSLEHIEKLKKKADFVIVLYHGGKEHYRYPSPWLRESCRRLIDKGADLVVCQHSHCIGCEEKYKNGTVVYGQGNFIFDGSTRECWKTSLLIKVDLNFHISYIPIEKIGNGVRKSENDNADKTLSEFYQRSSEIKLPGYVEEKYSEFASEFLYNYLRVLSGKHSVFFRLVNKLTSGRLLRKHLQRAYFNVSNAVSIANYVECEAHRELLLQGLKNIYEKSL